MSADLDPRNFREVQRRVVEPVVRAVIAPDELDEALVYGDDGDPWVRVTARGELVTSCWLGSLSAGPWDAADRAGHFYDTLTDDLPSTGFAWGERREGRSEVPRAER